MEIDRNNYEAHFLDYRENNLLPEQVAELMVFLEQNPDLKEEFNSFENITLIPEDEIRFGQKDKLKKKVIKPAGKINRDNYENFFIAKLEGDISEEESLELKDFFSLNPHLKLEYNLFKSTVLVPDKKIIYKNKNSLQKTGLFVVYKRQIIYTLSAAASVLILLGLYFGFGRKTVSDREYSYINRIEMIKPAYDQIKLKPELRRKYQHEELIASPEFKYSTENKPAELAQLPPKQISAVEIPLKFDTQNDFIELKGTRAIYDIEHAGINNSEKRNKSFIGRFIAGVANKIIGPGNPEKKSLLEYTVEGYNLLADRDVQVEKELDENGKVIAFNITGNSLEFARSKRKPTRE